MYVFENIIFADTFPGANPLTALSDSMYHKSCQSLALLTITQDGSAQTQGICSTRTHCLYHSVFHLLQDWRQEKHNPRLESEVIHTVDINV